MTTTNTPSFNGTDKMLKSENDDDLFKSAIDDTAGALVSDECTKENGEEDVEENENNSSMKEVNINNIPEILDDKLNLNEKLSPNILTDESRDQFIEIEVTEANKIGEGMSSYVTYKVETKTNIGLFRKKSMSVHRRFSDFLGLHDKLTEKYLRSGRIIPPAPEKNVFDGDLPKATNTSALSGAGVKRFFNKFGETVNKITYKMDENEPWFDEKTILLENIDIQLRKLHSNVELLVINRKDLAVSTSQFAKAAALLSNCEEHTGLSRALAQLADVEEKLENIHNDQAISDFSILCELLKDYVALIGAVRNTFHERVKSYQHWQHSQIMLKKKRELKDRMEYAKRTDKIEAISQEIIEWEAKVSRCEEEFQKVSKVIKLEFEQFENNRIKEFKTLVTNYLEVLAQHQTQVMKCWQIFLPEAKAIN
ncbi:hypothetical protein PGB90_008187 [Kerria lacca]